MSATVLTADPWAPAPDPSVARARALTALPTPDLTLPDLRVALPDGSQGTLPGASWPDLARRQAIIDAGGDGGGGGRFGPGQALWQTRLGTIAEADELLAEWQHPLGAASKRLFGRQVFVSEALGRPVAVCVSASTPNASVSREHGLHRYNTVELARLGRSDPAATLAALRIWREYCAPLFAEHSPKWEALRAAVTYSLPGTRASGEAGHGIYRRDGWVRLRRRRTSQPGPGSGWSRRSVTPAIADGQQGLWVHWYGEQPHAAAAAPAGEAQQLTLH